MKEENLRYFECQCGGFGASPDSTQMTLCCSKCRSMMPFVRWISTEEYEAILKEKINYRSAKPQSKPIEPRTIKEFNSNFVFQSPMEVTETLPKKTIIKGTLLSEGMSKNGRMYSIETLEKLDGLSDIPIFVGTGKNNQHSKASGVIGKIVKTIFDKVARKVRFIAEIFNKSIAESVKRGWGISIGGKGKGQILLDTLGRLITKVKSIILDHVQLLLPTTERGQESAQVETVINETMTFTTGFPKLSRNQIVKIVSALIKEGVI